MIYNLKSLDKEYLKENIKTRKVIKIDLGDKNVDKLWKVISPLVEDDFNVKNLSIKNNHLSVDLERRKPQKIVFPESDTHFDRTKDRYQYHTLLSAIYHLGSKPRKLAIDIGGHIGLYSVALETFFKDVVAFEPSPTNYECFEKNAKNTKLYKIGLGDKEETLKLNMSDDNTGNNSIVESFGEKTLDIEIKTLDSFEFKDVSLVKIDVQGFEDRVLQGAKKTLTEQKPIVVMEVITHKGMPPDQKLLDIMNSFEFKVVSIVGKDYIFRHKDV